MREQAIHAIDTLGPLDGLTADEALIIRFGRELPEARKVSDETFNAVRTRYGEKRLLELTAPIGVYTARHGPSAGTGRAAADAAQAILICRRAASLWARCC